MKYTAEKLEQRYQELTAIATAHCELVRDLVGGMPADEAGIAAFVKHHLHLVDAEAEAAVRRIMAEEIRIDKPEDELEERMGYSVNIIRRDEHGPWIGDWMLKACLKAAASRVGLYQKSKGTKGDTAEMGRVRALPPSLQDGHPERVHLVAPDGSIPQTYFDEIRGRISGPTGSRSIISHVEKVPAGAMFSFEFRSYASTRIKEQDLVDIFAAAQQIGLGSAKAFESGKFVVKELDITIPKIGKVA